MTHRIVVAERGWDLRVDGGGGCYYINHVDALGREHFVARFKNGRNPFQDALHFARFIAEHFTVPDYLAQVEARFNAPLDIARQRGYVRRGS